MTDVVGDVAASDVVDVDRGAVGGIAASTVVGNVAASDEADVVAVSERLMSLVMLQPVMWLMQTVVQLAVLQPVL